MTVVLIVLDGVGARWVRQDLMPTLAGWGAEGAVRPDGATSVLCSSTYPNFASIVTGSLPVDHGMFTNEVVVDGVSRRGSELGPNVPTFLGETSEVVVGDQDLIGVVAAYSAGRHWPPSGEVPAGTQLDSFGYVSDEEVTARVVESLERRPDLLFVQLNGPDTAAHIHGPESAEAIDSYRSLDRCLAVIDSAARSRWEGNLLLVTSDHARNGCSFAANRSPGVGAPPWVRGHGGSRGHGGDARGAWLFAVRLVRRSAGCRAVDDHR
ncbi:MAG: alkaline phosphatase family protein [Acidimicrobiia bacterium]